ncbi:cysteine desulfuration protein SufE, partial [Gordonia amicalis]|nr:cysteine desulfuration protein SufE [Gordonia amicalis]
MPPALAEIVEDCAALGDSDKITLLLEFAGDRPDLPEHLQREAMEPVP